MSDDGNEIIIPMLTFLPKNPKEALEWIKEAREPAINKAIKKMEKSPYYNIWVHDIDFN